MQTTALTPLPSTVLTPKANVRPTPSSQEHDAPAAEAFGKDTLSRFSTEAPGIALQSVPYLHGATVGHEGLHLKEEAHAAAREASGARRAIKGGRSAAIEESAMRTSAGVGYASGVALRGVLASGRSSALLGGALSLALHGYRVARGKETAASAGALIAGDVVLAGLSGMAGAATSTTAAAILGLSCGPLAIVGLGFGIAGYMASEWLLRETPAYHKLVDGLYHLLGGQGEAPRE